MSEFDEMTRTEQILLLEEFAHDVLTQYGLTGCEFECINHSYNTTFKFLGGDGKHYAIRIGTRERKWPEHTWAEVQWLLELNREGSVTAPVPVANLQGEYFSNHYFFYQGGNLDAVVYPWLEGELLTENPTEEQLFELGKEMATMHLLAKSWKPEGYANFLPRDKPLMVIEDNLFAFQLDEIPPAQYEILRQINERTEKLFETLRERNEPQLIHTDLQSENILWQNDKMKILDFDDTGIGFPVQDLAITIYYLRKDRESEKQLIAGYASVTPLPEFDPEDLELLIANRCLVLLNQFIGRTTLEDVPLIPEYLAETERRLKHYLDTGEFVLLD